MPHVVTRRRAITSLLGVTTALALAATGGPRAAAGGAAVEPSGAVVVPRGRDLVLVQADGAGERSLVSVEPGAFVTDGAWSPDRTRIVFSRYSARPGEGAGGADLAVVGTAGGAEPSVLVGRDGPGSLLAAPFWAPDGSRLAFENVGYSAAGGLVLRVEWVAADGSDRQVLVEGGRTPAFSPDGAAVAFIKTLTSGDGLWVRPLAGGPERQVVAEYELLAIAFPRFSPDGRQIAFAGIGDLARGPAQRTDLPGHRRPARAVAHRRRSFDREIAGASTRRHGLPWDLFVVDLTGANLRRLALLTEDDAAIAWSPDGRWVAVGGANGLRMVSAEDGSIRSVSSVGSFGGIDWR